MRLKKIIIKIYTTILLVLYLAFPTIALGNDQPSVVVDNTKAENAPQLVQTDKGVPQVNIVDPQNELSHNRFEKYNVGSKGMIINNSRYSGTVEGLGHVVANPNLSESAKTILFEVTGASRSELQGISTIVGNKAKFILANPNGITCDGCGFVNSHEVELRTDKLLSVSNGQINWANNPSSDIYVGGKGAVVKGGALLLSSGKIKVVGGIQATDLLKLEASYAQPTNNGNENKKEAIYAIDVSTISSISAGKIYLVSTGEGTGVRVATPKAIIDKDGKSQMFVRSNKKEIVIESQGPIDIQGSLYSKGELTLNGHDITLIDSTLIGSSNIVFNTKGQLYGNSNYVTSDGDFTIQANRFTDDKNKYDIGGSTKIQVSELESRLSDLSSKGQIEFNLDFLENKVSKVASDKTIKIDARDKVAINGGDVFSKENIIVDTKIFDLKGVLQRNSEGAPYLLGEIFGQNVQVTAKEKLLNVNGVIHAEKRAILTSPTVINRGGKEQIIDNSGQEHKFWLGNIRAGEEVTINSRELLENDGLIESGNNIAIKLMRLKNNGLINSTGDSFYSLSQEISHESKWLDSIENSGTMSAGGRMKIDLWKMPISKKAKDFQGGFYYVGNRLHIDREFTNNGYLIGRGIEISGAVLANFGEIYSSNDLNLKLRAFGLYNTGTINVENVFNMEGETFFNGVKEDGFGFHLTNNNLLKAGVINIDASGNIVLGIGKTIGLYGAMLSGSKVEIDGNLKSPLIQVEAKSHFDNTGNILTQKRFLFDGRSFENRGTIEVVSGDIKKFWNESENGSVDTTDAEEKKRPELFSGVPIFQATVKQFFKNYGTISSKTDEGIITIDGGINSDVENTGKFLANKLIIQAKNIQLKGSEKSAFLGEDSSIYIKAKNEIIVGDPFLQDVPPLEFDAHNYIFSADRFILADNAVLKDKGNLENNQGVYVFAKNIACRPKSTLHIASNILLGTELNEENIQDYQSPLEILQSNITTGIIVGNSLLQIETRGNHHITNKLEISGLLYPHKLNALYFNGNLASVNIKDKESNQKIEEPFIILSANLIDFDAEGLFDSSRAISLEANKLMMATGSSIRSNEWIKVVSEEMLGSGTFYSNQDVSLLAKTGNIGSLEAPKHYKVDAKGSVVIETPKIAFYGPIKTESGDILVKAQRRLINGDIDSGGSFTEILTDPQQEDLKVDFDKFMQEIKRVKGSDSLSQLSPLKIKAKKNIKFEGKDRRFIFDSKLLTAEAGNVLEIDCGTLILDNKVELKSSGLLKLTAYEDILGSGNLVSDSMVSVFSLGSIELNSIHSQGDQFLRANEGISIKQIDAGQNGEVKLYGKELDVKNIAAAKNLYLYGEKFNNDITFNKVKRAEIIEQKTEPIDLDAKNEKMKRTEEATQEENKQQESTTEFNVNTPMEIEEDFIFVGKSFVNKSRFKVGGNVTLDLTGGFLNDANGNMELQNDLFIRCSKGFVNYGDMYLRGLLQLESEYLVNNKKISANAIKAYLTGKGPSGRSIDQRENSLLESRESKVGIKLIAPNGGMYFGYKEELLPANPPHYLDRSQWGHIIGAPTCKDGEVGRKYTASQLISRGGSITIQSGEDVIFEGTKGYSNGDFMVVAKGNIEKKKLEYSYIDFYQDVHHNKDGGHWHHHYTENWFECEPRYATNILDIDIAAKGGNVLLDGGKDIVVSGNIFADKKIIFKGQNVKLEALKIFNERGQDNKGDNLQITATPSSDHISELVVQSTDKPLESKTTIGAGGIEFDVVKLIAGEGVILEANKDVILEAPIIFSKGDISIGAKAGSIMGMALFANYVDAINEKEVTFAISGSQGILATLKSILLFAPQGTLSLKGFVLSADNIEAVAKSIELSGAHETVVQYRRDEDSHLFSRSVRQTWESHTAAFLTEMAAKHISLTATEGDVHLKGVNIQTPEGKFEINALNGKALFEDYKIPHFVKTIEETSGLSFGGIFSMASVAPHERLGDTIINHIPALSAANNIHKMRSATDLAPLIQGAGELFRILTATSVTEVITDQLGVTLINGIPLPNGISFYKRITEEGTKWEQSIPTTLRATQGIGTINAKDVNLIGSALIADDGSIVINAGSFTHIPTINQFEQNFNMRERSFGITYSPTSVGWQFGMKDGESQVTGATPNHGGISAQDINLNVVRDANIGSPIVGKNVNANIGGNLLLETYQEVSKTRSNFRAINFGVNVDFVTKTVTPTGSFHLSNGRGSKSWAEVPAIIKGDNVYLDVKGKCNLIGSGILGKNITLNAKSLDWVDIHNKDEYKETSVGFDSGVLTSITGIDGSVKADFSFSNALTKSGEMASRAGSVIKGWFTFGQNKNDQEGVIRATISENAKVNLEENKDLSTLNRDESKMVETGERHEQTISLAIPIIDTAELQRRWENKETLLQQMIEDKSLPEPQREFAETEQEVTKLVKEEAVKEGLEPDDVQDAIAAVTEEEYAAKNLRKLSEYHDNKEVPVEEAIKVLRGEQPIKNDKGEIKFSEAPKQFDKYKEKPDTSEHPKSKESWSWEKPMEPWEEEVAIDDMLNIATFGVGGTAIKIGGIVGKTALKGGGKAISRGIKPAIEALKRFVGSKAKVEVVKNTRNQVIKEAVGKVGSKELSINQMKQQIVKGQAPKSITRVDKSGRLYEKDHIHFKDGSALNKDGSWKHGGKKLSNEEKKWLGKFDWGLPNE